MTPPKEGADATAERIARIIALAHSNAPQAASTVHINAGGVGVWLCASLFLVTLSVLALACLFVSTQLQDLRRADETMQAYIHAGYGPQPPQEKEPAP